MAKVPKPTEKAETIVNPGKNKSKGLSSTVRDKDEKIEAAVRGFLQVLKHHQLLHAM